MGNLPLQMIPGVVKSESPAAALGRFLDADKVRFVDGKAEKWSGWQKFHAEQLAGKTRGALSWSNEFGTQNTAYGTSERLYAIVGGDRLLNITPLRDSGDTEDPFTTEDGSAIVTVTHSNHGAAIGDHVFFANAAEVGGITIDGSYRVLTKIDANNYTIEHSAAATSDAGPGGGTVDYEYELNIGNESSVFSFGYGAGPYGEGTYGTERASGLEIELRRWSLDEYGNDMLASPFNGSLYLWREGTDDRAQPVANAPARARAMFVTGERFPFMLGTSNPMRVEWPDRDDITDWTPSATNTANNRNLRVGSKLMAGTPLIDLVNLVWSDTALYTFQFTGSNFIYESRVSGTNCGLAAPLAFTVVNGAAFWMSGHSLHMFNGAVSDIRNVGDIRDFVFKGLDRDHIGKSFCGYNAPHNEVIFGYVSKDSPDGEPDRYVAVNISDYSWTVGTLTRTAMTIYRPAQSSILMVGTDGYIYEHEIGKDADGQPMEAFITFGLYEIARGEQNVDVFGFIPDFQRQKGAVTVDLYTRDRPNSTANRDEITITIEEGQEIEDFRLEGRHFGLTLRSNVLGGDFRLGNVAIEAQAAGARR